ncbi:phage portal protein [Arcanobacterium phocae]|uniref:phage portal protein n=2 Tax=Arcanobacterium phocae TaxID=131112 RepID=UPI00209FAC65|nr:phage portal protein [Arcanobacterium phocae]
MPNRMTVGHDEAGRLYYEYQRTWDEPSGRFETVTSAIRNVLHIPGFGFDGLVGYSSIAMV